MIDQLTADGVDAGDTDAVIGIDRVTPATETPLSSIVTVGGGGALPPVAQLTASARLNSAAANRKGLFIVRPLDLAVKSGPIAFVRDLWPFLCSLKASFSAESVT